VLHSSEWVDQLFWVWREDLVVRVLNLDVLLLDDSFHPFVELKVKALLGNRLQARYDSIYITVFISFFDE